jgi:hypothetical protein
LFGQRTWDEPAGERSYWARIASQRGEYHLDQAAPPLAESAPALERLAAAASHALASGHLNWITTNRILGKRIDHAGSASTLALLVAANALDPTSHWQQLHKVAEGAEALVSSLFAKLQRDGSISWTDPEGQTAAASMWRRTKATDLGWIDPVELARLLSAVAENRTPVASHDDAADTDPLAQLLTARTSKRRDERLDDLFASLSVERNRQGTDE